MNSFIKKLVIKWNNQFPLDNWYRKKYNIPFNSERHREVSQIDIYFEWLEHRAIEKLSESKIQEELRKDHKIGDFYLTPKLSQEELTSNEKELFDKIDIENIQF